LQIILDLLAGKRKRGVSRWLLRSSCSVFIDFLVTDGYYDGEYGGDWKTRAPFDVMLVVKS